MIPLIGFISLVILGAIAFRTRRDLKTTRSALESTATIAMDTYTRLGLKEAAVEARVWQLEAEFAVLRQQCEDSMNSTLPTRFKPKPFRKKKPGPYTTKPATP